MITFLRQILRPTCAHCAVLSRLARKQQALIDDVMKDNLKLRMSNLQLQDEATEYRELVGAVVVRKEARA